jgi:hypothetical protein
VRIREGVTATRGWSEIGPGLYVRLADYYVRREPGSAAEQVDRFLALAIFSEALQASDRAAGYANLAFAADPSAADQVKRWFPDVEVGP